MTYIHDTFEEILSATEQRVQNSQHAHWLASNTFDELARLATIANITGGAVVSALSTFAFAFRELYASYDTVVNAVMFLVGLGVSTISVAQSVMKWQERAQSHFFAANAYTSLRRDLEILKLTLPDSSVTLPALIERLRFVSETTPAVPLRLWKRAVAKAAG